MPEYLFTYLLINRIVNTLYIFNISKILYYKYSNYRSFRKLYKISHISELIIETLVLILDVTNDDKQQEGF